MGGPRSSHGGVQHGTKRQTDDGGSAASPEGACTHDRAIRQASGVDNEVGQRQSRLSAVLGRVIVTCLDHGYIDWAVWLWRLPLGWGYWAIAAGTMDSIFHLQGRPDVLAHLVTHLVAEQDMHRPLQLMTALLRLQRVDALCALCCDMAAAGHVTQVATLLAEAARQGCHEELAALILHMVREERLETARNIVVVTLVNRCEDAIGQVLMHMLERGGVEQVAKLGVAVAEAGGIVLACNAKRALLRWQEARRLPMDSVCTVVIRMGRADVIAQGLIQLHGEEHLDIVARAMGSMQSREAVEATVQVSLVLASSTRSDVMTKVKLGLLQHGSFDVAKDCTKTCVEMGHAWVPAALSLELLRMGKIGEDIDMIRGVAEDGRADLLAKTMGVMVRGDHAKEWADIARELHKQGLFWIVADIIAELVPAGRVAAEAHNAIFDYLGPEVQTRVQEQRASYAPGRAWPKNFRQAADVHILMVDRGHLDEAIQLAAALVISTQTPRLVRVLTSIVDDRDRADVVARKQIRCLETGHADLVAMVHNQLVHEGRVLEGMKLAAALAEIVDVVQLLERLRAAGTQIMPEVWHYVTAAHLRGAAVVHPDHAPSPGGCWKEQEPDVLEDAGLSTGDSQPVVSGIQAVDGDQLRRSPLESMPAEKQDAEEQQSASAEQLELQPTTPPMSVPSSRSLCPQVMGSPDLIRPGDPTAGSMQRKPASMPA